MATRYAESFAPITLYIGLAHAPWLCDGIEELSALLRPSGCPPFSQLSLNQIFHWNPSFFCRCLRQA